MVRPQERHRHDKPRSKPKEVAGDRLGDISVIVDVKDQMVEVSRQAEKD